MIRYSVVIPVYRVEEYLPACIDSVLAQETESAYEILLIDDGSPDRCGEICDEYAAKDSRIRVLHIENQGVSHARNLGIQNAHGDYMLFLDSDDYWEPGFLQTVDSVTESMPDMALVGCMRAYEDGRKEVFRLSSVPKGESGEAFLAGLFAANRVPPFFSVCYAYRRTFILANQLFFPEDLKVSEDFVQIMGAIALASSITGCDRPVYNYRMRSGSATATVTEKKLMDNLTTKAAFFRRYPTASMANLYANNALLVSQLTKQELSQVKPYLKANRDIWHHVSEPPLKLGRILVACFGDYRGVAVYHLIRKLVRTLLRK